MKKLILTAIAVLVFTSTAYAQKRGLQQNLYASWLSVSHIAKSRSLPYRTATERYTSRDIFIRNGGLSTIYVNLNGSDFPTSSVVNCAWQSTSATLPTIFAIEAGGDFHIQDYPTSTIGFFASQASSSPVSIVVTY